MFSDRMKVLARVKVSVKIRPPETRKWKKRVRGTSRMYQHMRFETKIWVHQKKKKKSLHFLFSGIVMWVSPMRTRNVVPTTYVGQQHAFVVLLQNYLLG